MASSGTYTFSPEVAEICEEAFERCGVNPEKLDIRHVRSARRSLDLLFSSWINRHVALWAVDQQSATVVQGVATVTPPAETVAILEAYIARDGSRTELVPMDREEYGLYASDTSQAMPTGFYFARTKAPSIKLWQLPENSTDTLHYYRVRRLQDVGEASNTLDIPYRWLEAVTSGLAAKLAPKYALEREPGLLQVAEMEFLRARQEDRERVPTKFRLRYGRR
jgi:hypothetical protein